MNFKLNESNGKVKYLNRYHNEVVGSDTTLNNAQWLLTHGKPEKSDEFHGYPIAVEANGGEYFLSGEWLTESAPQTTQKATHSPDHGADDEEEGQKRKPAEKPQKRRRAKDVVCE